MSEINIKVDIDYGLQLNFNGGGYGGVSLKIISGSGGKGKEIIIEEFDLDKVYSAIGHALAINKLNKIL